MRRKDLIYIILMVFFFVLAYFLFDRGFNARTKIIVNYKEDSNVLYKVYLHENKDILDEYMTMDKRYITKLVDNIGLTFIYNNFYSSPVFGYYAYDVIGTLYVYDKDSNDLLIRNDYPLLEKKTFVLNQNDNKINIEDKYLLDYDKYYLDFLNIKNNYNIDVNGYLEINFNIYHNLLFKGIEKEVKDDRKIIIKIPLSLDTFKIDVNKGSNNMASYYDFSTKEKINYVFLLIGSFMLAIGISFMALVIRQMVFSYYRQVGYRRDFNKILKENDDILVKVKKFYNQKNYNLIYVDNFNELIDIYKKIGNPISYREIRKNMETIFVLVDQDNAWIYRLINKDNR